MNIPESWLRSFCNPALSGSALADRLTMSGLEVEAYEPLAPALNGAVVGEVLSVEKHPSADKLVVCKVKAGRETLTVVCGAPNVRVGMKAPLKAGAKEIRGVLSQGMLCSARDLGLSDDHSGLLEIDDEAEDHILTLKLTPNRADCLSVLGVAREVAAVTGAKLRVPAIKPVPKTIADQHPVKLPVPEACGRFAGRVIRGVDARAQTPAWMRERLERAGQRSISALVDVTNYVMLELGRPLHVYDLDKLRGPIVVRWGRKGEKVLLLNEQEVEVSESVLCITDDSGVIGLGGIMGGESTKADEGTRNVFLESAFFHPDAIAGRARAYSFTSDASHRFERGVDFDNNVEGIERATRLILEICGGEPGPTVDTVAKLPKRKPVTMRVARAQKVIGVPVPEKEMASAFRRLGFSFRKAKGAFSVTPPSYRFDLSIEEDLIEEVARLYGFERIAAHPPRVAATMLRVPEARRSLHALRERLVAAEYREVVNFSFVEPDWEADFAGEANPVRLLNPIVSQQSVMRTSLIGSLVSNIRYNHARKVPRIRVFEVGRVFLRDPAAEDGPLAVRGVRQPLRMAAAAYGPALAEQWDSPPRGVDFYDVKADLESLLAPLAARFEPVPHPAFHPGRCARLLLGGKAAGWLGELHPKWLQKYELPQAPVLFEVDVEALRQAPLPQPAVPSDQPVVLRDISMLFGLETPLQAILDAMEAEKPRIVQRITLLSVFRGAGVPENRKSLAFRVVMQDTERTLTDAEADAARDSLVALLGRKFAANLRT
jgi:phenylalanyl-tRNA synthetase beta chain